MSSIGSVNFDIMHGLPTQQKTQVDTWHVPGLDGVGAQTFGAVGDEFDLVTVSFHEDSDAANTFLDSCNALQGTVQDIEDDFEDDYDSVLVLKCDTTNAKRPCILDGSPAIRCQVQWRMVATI